MHIGAKPLPPARTLPLHVEPLPGEALDSWLEALAHRHQVPFGDVLHQCGITCARPGAWIRLLDRDVLGRIAQVTDLDPEDVDAMALPRPDRASPAVGANGCVARTLPSGLWDWRPNSRYCPHCLDDSAGRWQLAWRINWTFACQAHQCLLVDACPECLCEQRAKPHPMTRLPYLGRCRGVHRRHPSGELRACGAQLASTQPVDLCGSPMILQAQRQVMRLLLAEAPIAARRGQRSLAALDTLRVLVRWVAMTIDCAQLQPQAVLACCDSDHLNFAAPYSGRTAQNTAAETAASVTTALTILNAHSITEAEHTWRDLMIAATHGRIHRLSEADQDTLTPSLRLAYRRAYADANAHHKLRRYFSISGAKHQSRLAGTAHDDRHRNAEQRWAR